MNLANKKKALRLTKKESDRTYFMNDSEITDGRFKDSGEKSAPAVLRNMNQ